jgi:hypothetical protein
MNPPCRDGGRYRPREVRKESYSIDPSGRVRKIVAEGTTNLTTIDHYGGGGEALTWKDEGSGKYTRLIPGIDGSLCATETNGLAPVLQVHDLQGDIVATAALSETETKLLSKYESTEFGVPVNGPPPTKYSWLGAAAVSSELSSGELVTGTVAYQPQLGRALQTQAVVPPGMAVNGAEGSAYISQVSVRSGPSRCPAKVDPGSAGGMIQIWLIHAAARHKLARLRCAEHTHARRVCDPLHER